MSNSLAKGQIDNLYHCIDSRCIRVRKQDESSRPVGTGDIFRGLLLITIDCYRKRSIQMNCQRPLDNNSQSGSNSISYSVRKFTDSMVNSKFVALTMDASNTNNSRDGEKSLNLIFDKAPGLYLSA